MRPAIIIFLFYISLTSSFAQKIKVISSSEKMDDITRSGLSTIVELDTKDVEKAWEHQLKTWGKLESTKGGFMIAVANVPQVSNKPCTVYSLIDKSNKGTKVWYAIDLGNSYVGADNNGAEKILHDFAVSCYKEDINEQIKDAEKALSTSVKKQEKEMKHGEQLIKNIEKNKQEKSKLEQELQQNGKDLEQLKKEIEQNKTDQSAAAADIEKMKKAVEVVKQKINALE